MPSKLFFIIAFSIKLYCVQENTRYGMLTNDDCTSWYYRVGGLLLPVWNRRNELVREVRQIKPIPECKVNDS